MGFFVLSVISLLVSAVIFFLKMDQILNLAGTQWILVSIILGVYALYLKNDSADECKKD